MLPETAAMIDLASTMIAEGHGSKLMPREADSSSPITAYRWESNLYDNLTIYCLFFLPKCNILSIM